MSILSNLHVTRLSFIFNVNHNEKQEFVKRTRIGKNRNLAASD